MLFNIIFLLFEIGFAGYLWWEHQFLLKDSEAMRNDLLEISKRLEVLIEGIDSPTNLGQNKVHEEPPYKDSTGNKHYVHPGNCECRWCSKPG